MKQKGNNNLKYCKTCVATYKQCKEKSVFCKVQQIINDNMENKPNERI